MLHRGLLLAGAGALCAGVSAFACSSDPSPGADGPDAGPDPVCEGNLTAFRFPGGGDGSSDPFGAKAAGQARAGRIKDAAQIVQPDNARNKVRVGDFVLANEKVAVYIEAEGESDGYNPLGGDVLALELIGPDGKPTGVSQFNETLIMLSRQTVKPEKVTVLADGADGKAAIVRVSGQLANVPFLDTFKPLLPDEYDFPAAIDYVLEPGASKVLVRLQLVNTRTDAVDFANKQYFGFFQANRSQVFTESQGFGEPKGETPWVAFDSTKSAFLYRALGSPLRAEIGISGFQLYSLKGLALDACATKTVDYAEMMVGGPGIDGLLEVKRAALGEPAWREVKGVLKEPDGVVLPGALVHATAADGRYLSRTVTDAAGAYVLHLPAADVQLTPTLKGWPIPAATAVSAASTTADLALPKRATLEVNVKDATSSEPLPARVQIIPTTAIAAAPAAFGVRDADPNGRLWMDFAVTGRALLPVPPGQHRVIVTRGYEYELYDAPASATLGTTTTIDVPLARSVESPGVMCADFHIHSHFSADSDDEPEFKVRGAVADGLELPISSEHEWILDFQPIIQRLGLTKWAYGFPSEELTTFAWGHFGVIPINPRSEAVNNGAAPWIGKKPGGFFKDVNALPEKPVLVINHPASGGFLGYFSAASYDRATGKGDPELWSDDFAALEVFNETDFEANRAASVADWFSLLNFGKTIWTTGSSDSHHQRTSPVGYPRTCLRFGHDDPTKLSAETVRDVLRSGAAVISGGLTMTVEGPGGIGPGGTAAAGAYKITVACPSWLTASSLEVIVDGLTTETRPLTALAGPGPGKRYEVTVNVSAAQSKPRHWVVFHAKGAGTGPDGDLAPLHPGRKPFAVSNPIFFGP
ncbi:MAG TPA: CehA/McbA family metallohydrolase [Labilithrix sp.]|nr:CehA/McbA family metallohydrolase [Labilithrix sp.]